MGMEDVANPPESEEPKPSVWTGPAKVHVVRLDAPQEDCLKRYKASSAFAGEKGPAAVIVNRWQNFYDAFGREAEGFASVFGAAEEGDSKVS